MPKRPVIHLAECEPEDHPAWVRTTAFQAWNVYEAQHCPQTAYMAAELYPDEIVWIEDRKADA